MCFIVIQLLYHKMFNSSKKQDSFMSFVGVDQNI